MFFPGHPTLTRRVTSASISDVGSILPVPDTLGKSKQMTSRFARSRSRKISRILKSHDFSYGNSISAPRAKLRFPNDSSRCRALASLA